MRSSFCSRRFTGPAVELLVWTGFIVISDPGVCFEPWAVELWAHDSGLMANEEMVLHVDSVSYHPTLPWAFGEDL